MQHTVVTARHQRLGRLPVAGVRYAAMVLLAYPFFYYGTFLRWHGYPIELWAPDAYLAFYAVRDRRGWGRIVASTLMFPIGVAAQTQAGAPLGSAVVATGVTLAAAWGAAIVGGRLHDRLDPTRRRRLDAPLALLGVSVASASAAVAVVEGAWLAHLAPGHGLPVQMVWFLLAARAAAMFLAGVPTVLPRSQRSWWPPQFKESRAARIDCLVQPALTVLFGTLLATHHPGHVTYLGLALLIWAAIRLPILWTLAELAALGLFITLLTGRNLGPFSGPRWRIPHGWMDTLLGSAQSYLLVVAALTITLALYVMTTRWQEWAIMSNQQLHRETLDAAVVGIMMLSPALPGQPPRISHTNRLSRELLGLPEGPVLMQAWLDRLDPGERDHVQQTVNRVLRGETPRAQAEFWLSTDDGRRRISVALSALRTTGGDNPVSVQLIDVTDQHTVQHQLAELALHDPLTGLGNRTLLYDRLDHWQEVGSREGTSSMLVYADLDDFKRINDTYGHEAGDEVLVEVATRLEGVVRAQDTVARLGGDEFAVLVPQVRPGDVEFCERMVQRLRQALAVPLRTEWGMLTCGASLGWTLSDSGTSNETLLRQADRAMYEVKAATKGLLLPQQARSPEGHTTTEELRVALEQGQFELFVQPLVDLPTGFILGGEALVRWNHPTRGLLGPDTWLEVAEGSELIRRLGSWVISESCVLAARWREELGEDSPVMHANISARQLGHGTLVGDVQRSLARTGLPPDKLVIELTETQLDQSAQAVDHEIATLRQAGIQLAADDFGTGYSSLTRLTDMPIDIVKIDRTFVGRMENDERAHAVVAALLTMGNELGLEVVAEGVETERQALDLRRLGCSVAQGYLWSRPVPADTFLSLAGAQTRAGAAPVM